MEIKHLSQYALFEKIGEGINGSVYKAWDNNQHRTVAIKMLNLSLHDLTLNHRLAVAKSLKHVDHPNLCAVFGVEQQEGQAYIVMELVHGVTLKEIILTRQRDKHPFLHLGYQAALGLRQIHELRLVHGNLKPSNLMVNDRGEVKLLDAGLSPFKDFQTTPEFRPPYEAFHYLAPEQIRNERASVKTDLWALGVMFYQLLLGELPFEGGDEEALSCAIMNTPASFNNFYDDQIPGDQIFLVQKLLAKEPSDRITNSGELVVTLKEMVAFNEELQDRPEETKPPQPPVGKYTAIMIIVALLFILWYVIVYYRP